VTHWAFVIAAYAITLVGTVGLLAWAYASMRKAEAAADELRRPE
jgi:Flp pilus assembly protein CpaB